MQAMQKKQDIISQIRDLGLAKGDTVFVSSDLLRVGYFNKDQVTTLCDWIEIFDELLGDKGTIVVPTYSPSFLRFIQKYDFVFTAESDSDSGGLARAYIHHAKGAVRGRHPTNSCTSRGAHAETIAASDGPEFPKYNPYAKVVELGGKNLMLGTVDERNCPFTYHHVQELLGQTRGHPFSGFLETTYIDESGQKKKYIMRELGGCTAGVHKSWGHHMAQNAVRFGRVGRSLSALVDARKSTEILRKIMVQTPGLMKCDDRSCVSCYGRFCYNGVGVVSFYPRQIPKLVTKVWRRAVG